MLEKPQLLAILRTVEHFSSRIRVVASGGSCLINGSGESADFGQVGGYSGPRKLDHRLSYTGGPEEGNQWRVSGRSTGGASRPRAHWPLTRATAQSTRWPGTTAATPPLFPPRRSSPSPRRCGSL